jgi:chitinase
VFVAQEASFVFKITNNAGLGLALILTTLCYGQANYQGAPHNVIYSNGSDTYDNDAFPEIANSDYTDVIVNFITVDASVSSNCQFTSQPYISPSDMQTLHNAGKTVLVSFGGADNVNQNTGEDYTSEAYQACSGNVDNLASQIANFVYANGFNGVDIDFEDSSAFNAGGAYDGVAFLTELTDDLYYQLSQAPFFEQNIITHAPQTAYWLDDYNYPYPPYAQIFWNSGNEIAWFNNQTYNNCLNGGNTDCTATDKINNYTNPHYS